MVTGIQFIAVYVTDLRAARRFYVDILGLTRYEDQAPGELLKAGSTLVYLEGGRSGRQVAGLTGPQTAICFATQSVEAAYRRLAGMGVAVVEPYRSIGLEFAMFRVADPDGNVVAFAGRP